MIAAIKNVMTTKAMAKFFLAAFFDLGCSMVCATTLTVHLSLYEALSAVSSPLLRALLT